MLTTWNQDVQDYGQFSWQFLTPLSLMNERVWFCASSSCSCVFSTLTPECNFTVQDPGYVIVHCNPWNQWTRLDPESGWLSPRFQHNISSYPSGCMHMLNLVIIVAYVCPSGVNSCWFPGQVWVQLTRLNAHVMKKSGPWGPLPLSCQKTS